MSDRILLKPVLQKQIQFCGFKLVKQTYPYQHNSSETGWEILGELELPAGSLTPEACHDWLKRTLARFNLHTDFLSTVSNTVREAVERAHKSEQAILNSKHIHLRVFAPDKDVTKLNMGQTWGFFLLAKVGSSTGDGSLSEQSIELYLYLEM